MLNRRFDDVLQEFEHWWQFQHVYYTGSCSTREANSGQNQATVRSGLLNATVPCTSSFFDSNQWCTSSARKVAADPERSLKHPVITADKRGGISTFVTSNVRQTRERRRSSRASFLLLEIFSVSRNCLIVVRCWRSRWNRCHRFFSDMCVTSNLLANGFADKSTKNGVSIQTL